MFELIDDDLIRSSVSVLVTDYLAGNKAVFVSVEVPDRRLSQPEFTIQIVIDAPSYFAPSDATARYVFFIDLPSTARTLVEGQYQIIFEGPEDDKHAFYTWARECADFFKVMQFNVGLVCVDYADFVSVLNACKGKTLHFVKLKYDPLADRPFIDNSGLQYRVIYGCFSGPGDVSLTEYNACVEVLQAANPNLEELKLALKLVRTEGDSIMFLGEAIPAR